MTKLERLNEAFASCYTEDEVVDMFIYLTNPSRGDCLKPDEIRTYYQSGRVGQMLKEYDPISFECES